MGSHRDQQQLHTAGLEGYPNVAVSQQILALPRQSGRGVVASPLVDAVIHTSRL